MTTLNFDAASVAPAQPFEIIPPGKYICQIVQSEMRPTKDGNGSYLWLELDVLEGEFSGRKIWDRLNLANHNQQAVDIAKRQLSALANACGKAFVRDSEELHLTPIEVTVRVRPTKGDYEASNEIRGYAPIGGGRPVAAARRPETTTAPAPSVAPTTAPAPSVAPTTQPAQTGVPAWRRHKTS